MSKLCPNCGQLIDDNATTCAFCKHDVNDVETKTKLEDVLEVPSLEDIKPTVEKRKEDDVINEVESKTEKETALEGNMVNQSENKVMETSINDEIVSISIDDVQPLDDDVVENNSLETVTVESVDEKLDAEEEKISIPELPEATIGEINPDLLGNKYDEEEKANNEKLEAKKKKDEEELERKRREEEEKQKIPMEKPDLLATSSDVTDDGIISNSPKKSGKIVKRVMNIILVILALAVVVVIVWYCLRNLNDEKAANYMDPITTYFKGYEEGDASKMLSSFVPCVAETEEITNLITSTVENKSQYGTLTIKFSEKTSEVVNTDDQSSLDEYLFNMCGADLPTISEYRHVYVDETIIVEDYDDDTENIPEFWTVKIDDEWYILLIQ